MVFETLTALTSSRAVTQGSRNPVAVLFAEDGTEVESTIRHNQKLGFQTVIVIDAIGQQIPADLTETILHLPLAFHGAAEVAAILNQLIPALRGRWVYFGFNAEYLFFAGQESRSIQDVVTFMEEERRSAVFGTTLDLYASDLEAAPNGVDLENTFFDRSGYYSEPRFEGPVPLDHQIEVYGGLKWRFEEHIPWKQRRLDRVPLFKAAPGLTMNEDLVLSEPDMNTVSCPWHHNLTVSVCSFRTAKGLLKNPHSREKIGSLMAPQSAPFGWTSQQLLDVGFMEAGQWF